MFSFEGTHSGARISQLFPAVNHYAIYLIPFICLNLSLLLSGGYYTIEQTKSRLRIIALNTNYMRHDVKYSQSHSSPVRQRPDGSTHYSNMYYHHGKHYNHHDNENRYYGSATNDGGSGGTVSALSGSNSHESEKQWEWLEDVLAKSSRNKETVSTFSFNSIHSHSVSH